MILSQRLAYGQAAITEPVYRKLRGDRRPALRECSWCCCQGGGQRLWRKQRSVARQNRHFPACRWLHWCHRTTATTFQRELSMTRPRSNTARSNKRRPGGQRGRSGSASGNCGYAACAGAGAAEPSAAPGRAGHLCPTMKPRAPVQRIERQPSTPKVAGRVVRASHAGCRKCPSRFGRPRPPMRSSCLDGAAGEIRPQPFGKAQSWDAKQCLPRAAHGIAPSRHGVPPSSWPD